MTASLIASLLLRCKRRVPVAPSVPSLRSSHDGVARYFASLAMQTACASSQGGVAHCFASLALQTACAWGAVGPFASLVTCGVAHCFSLLLRCNRRVLVAPSAPSLRLSHDGVAHCFASLASQTVCACGAVGLFASLVT